MAAQMEQTKTFVFLDLETTGLPHHIPKITELSLVAASVEQILETHDGTLKENSHHVDFLPRVLNVINLPVCPQKMIQPLASNISGLTNESLELQKPFDGNLYNLIELFLERLEMPICFVAHNGSKFDFPILQSELNKIDKKLPDGIFCADSLPGFREVLNSPSETKAEQPNQEDVLLGIQPLNPTSSNLPWCEWSNEDYNSELVRVTEAAESVAGIETYFDPQELQMKIKREMDKIKKRNETTPTRNSQTTTPPPIKDAKARRKILNDKPKRTYHLGSLYSSLVGREMKHAHRAEADCLALLECVTAVGKPIIEWLDSKKVPFRSVRRMW